MCLQSWILACLHEQLSREFEKSFCWYLPMEACLVVIWVNLVYKELEFSMNGSHEPLLVYIGFRTFPLLSSKSKKSWPLLWLLGKVSCHSFKISLHFFFLLNKKEFLLGNVGKSLASFTWVLTILCLGHSVLLGQYQK